LSFDELDFDELVIQWVKVLMDFGFGKIELKLHQCMSYFPKKQNHVHTTHNIQTIMMGPSIELGSPWFKQ